MFSTEKKIIQYGTQKSSTYALKLPSRIYTKCGVMLLSFEQNVSLLTAESDTNKGTYSVHHF